MIFFMFEILNSTSKFFEIIAHVEIIVDNVFHVENKFRRTNFSKSSNISKSLSMTSMTFLHVRNQTRRVTRVLIKELCKFVEH